MSRTTTTDPPGNSGCYPPFLTIAEAAEFLKVNPRTLDNMRWKHTGPVFRRHGGRVVYCRKELLEWSRGGRAK